VGRIVSGIYTLFNLITIYLVGKKLFNQKVALISLFFLVCSPAVRFFLYGRQVLGEIPAFGFFLAGWLMWVRASFERNFWMAIISGIFFGAAIVTKNQYMMIAGATLVIMTLMDLFKDRLGVYKYTFLTGFVALTCVAGWYVWQIIYFGKETFLENADKLSQLAQVTMGLKLGTALGGIRSIFGSDTGNYYLYWGFFALLYFIPWILKKDIQSHHFTFLYLFTLLWLGYYIFGTLSWQRYAIPAMGLTVVFISKLFYDLSIAFFSTFQDLKLDIIETFKFKKTLNLKSILAWDRFTFFCLMVRLSG
jgi:4-amino-4-deoxy-L-arabinose transferase-like glycosyltransferase